MRRYLIINRFILTLILFGIAFILTIIFTPTSKKLFELQTHHSRMKQKLILEEKQNINLKRELNGLTNDPNWIEKVAREKLGWCSPKETVYRFQTSDSNK